MYSIRAMKTEIHPDYHQKAQVTCACGNTFTTGSTDEKIEVEICSNCHPFYTGVEKVVDTAGRVEKFKARMSAKTDTKSKAEKKAEKKAARAEKTASTEKNEAESAEA